MKTKIETRLFFFIIMFCIVFCQAGCKKKTDPDEGTNNPTLTDIEIKEILKADSLISLTADSILLFSAKPGESWQIELPYYKSIEVVEDAWVTNTTLFVKFKKGGLIGWHHPGYTFDTIVKRQDQEGSISTQPRNRQELKNMPGILNLVGNKNVLFVNNFYDDPQFECWNNILQDLSVDFQSKGFTVTLKKGDEANLNFFRTDLKGYGVIYNLGHGSYDGVNHWLQTGQHASDWQTPIEFLLNINNDPVTYQEWKDGKIAAMDVYEIHFGFQIRRGYIWISQKLIDARYSNNDFPNSMIYLMSCQQFKGNYNVGNVYHSKGAGVVLGWTEIHDIATPYLPEAAIVLMTSMLQNPIDLQTAYNSLPEEKRLQKIDANTISELKLYPSDGGSIQLDLIKPQLQTPVNGYVTSSLTPTLTCQPYSGATNYNFQVATESNFNNIIVNANSSPCQYQIASGILATGTQCFWRVMVTISNGSSPWSDVWSFTTFNNNQLATLTTTEVTNITQNSAQSGGNISSDGGSIVTIRGVCWHTSPNPTISDAHTIDGNGTGNFMSNITGLAANTPYYVRAYATNTSGTAYGNQLSFTSTGGSSGQPCPGVTTVFYEGKTYNTVQIGTQCWFKENLNVGARIETYQLQNDTNGIIEKYCYNNLETNCNNYGGLYSWDEMMKGSTTQGVQGICPLGWHIPTDVEWTTLTTYLGGEYVAGGKMKESGTIHWSSPNFGATNSSGFTALPGGMVNYGNSNDFTNYGNFWSSCQTDANNATYHQLRFNNEVLSWYVWLKSWSYSVRCLKD